MVCVLNHALSGLEPFTKKKKKIVQTDFQSPKHILEMFPTTSLVSSLQPTNVDSDSLPTEWQRAATVVFTGYFMMDP